MALDKSNFTVMGQGNGSKICFYRSDDAIATINTAGYFNDLAAVLSLGDVIFVQTVTAPAAPTAISAINIVYVNGNDGTTVDVTDGLAITATDTD